MARQQRLPDGLLPIDEDPGELPADQCESDLAQ